MNLSLIIHLIMVSKYSILDAINIAKNRGGICLSEKLNSCGDFLRFKCANNHIWKATLSTVKKGSWCPYCSAGFYERVLSEFLKQKIICNFVKERPAWLINPKTGHKLELDFYNNENKIAFEHNGAQHYKNTHSFGNFVDIKYRDDVKRKLCEDKGIDLIIIPEICNILPIADLSNLVKNELKLINKEYLMKDNYDRISCDYTKAYINSKEREFNEKLKEIIKKRGGVLLSKCYIGMHSRIKIKCNKGHVWETITKHIIYNNSWCRKCGVEKRRYNLDLCKEIAKKNGGKCLAKKVVNNRDPILWQCSKEHKWKTNPYNIKSGHWCPYCAGKKININIIKEIASKKNIKCLSEKFISVKTIMKWKCEKGHIFYRSYNYLKNRIDKDWCIECKKIRNKT